MPPNDLFARNSTRVNGLNLRCWRDILRSCEPLRMRNLPIDFVEDYDNASILAELKRLAAVRGSNNVTKADIDAHGRLSYILVYRRFGSLRQALQMAGLKPGPFTKATKDELLAIIVELWEKTLEREGRTPQRKDLKTYGMPVSGDTLIRKFGTWRKALLAAHASVTQDSLPDESVTLSTSPTPNSRKHLSVRKRFFVMKRDGFACVRCSASGRGVRLEVHHRTPFAQGGSDALDNLETLCFGCNRGQRDDMVK
jgi:hypothetical protein